jgi:3-oxoadipate enol-lactonase
MEKVNGIAYQDEGDRAGTPIVLIHGFPFNRKMWAGQVGPLSKICRVISYDVRGHGQSDVGDANYSLESFVDDLFGIMEHLKLRRTIVCGLSMGGYIALRAVERHPEKFRALILCDTKSSSDSDEARKKRALSAESVKKNGVSSFADEFVRSVLCEKSLATKPELVESVKSMIRGNSALGIAGTLHAIAGRTDTTPALPKMSLRTLILVGDQDKPTPPADAEMMAKNMPDARMYLIPGAGHLSNLENPDVFNEKLLTFAANHSLLDA